MRDREDKSLLAFFVFPELENVDILILREVEELLEFFKISTAVCRVDHLIILHCTRRERNL